jgi:hypothetical protein
LKVKVECDSPLLQYTLEYFLKDYIDNSGILITDNPEKNGITIGKEIKKPFTKTSLLLQLEKILNIKNNEETIEDKIEKILENCKKELIKTIKEHYGKE